MKIYVRKVFDHDVTHEVSVRTDIVNEFFDDKCDGVCFVGKTSKEKGIVTICSATDPRFGGDFKSLLVKEGGIAENDIILVYKYKTNYELEIVKPSDSRYNTYFNLFTGLDRHEIIYPDEGNPEKFLHFSTPAKAGYNKIYYGCPGCGKSHNVQKELEDNKVPDTDIFRVTFHPEYSNFDFVGQVMPTAETKTNPDGTTVDIVKYDFQAGPFTLALKRAQETESMVYLIIEEINRGNAAAIFGDLFQLLDRDKKPILDDGTANPRFCSSEYPITNVAIQKELGIDKVVIPSNLTIIGTMNTSDQNVFTLDTAFKRRWEFEQVNNEFTTIDVIGDKFIPGSNVTWRTFVEKVNKKIAKQGMNNSISDDKRIGKYFVSEDMLTDTYTPIKDGSGNIDKNIQDKAKRFAYKVLEYIWNDVAKFDDKINWFDTSSIFTLEELIAKFIDTTANNPVAVFIGDLF